MNKYRLVADNANFVNVNLYDKTSNGKLLPISKN